MIFTDDTVEKLGSHQQNHERFIPLRLFAAAGTERGGEHSRRAAGDDGAPYRPSPVLHA